MKRHIVGHSLAALFLAALTACGGGSDNVDSSSSAPAHTGKASASAARGTAPQVQSEPELSASSTTTAMAGWQALLLQGQVLEGGKAQGQRRISALLGEQVLATGTTDSQGRYTLMLGIDRASAGIVRLRVTEDAAHPRSRMEVLLGGPATLAALGSRNGQLSTDLLSALRIDELSTAESARLLNYHRASTQQADLRDEAAFKTALQGFTLEDVSDLTALGQLFLRKELPAPAGVTTLWQLLTDDLALRGFRATAHEKLDERYTQLRNDARGGLYTRTPYRTGSLPQHAVLATMSAYEPTPVFQTAKGGDDLLLGTEGHGQLHGAQTYPAGHEQLKWQLNDKGGLELRGPGTELASGVNDMGQEYHEHLVRLHRLSRTAYGDVLMATMCGSSKPCSIDDDGSSTSFSEQLRLALRVTNAPAFDARSVPGQWFLPIAVTTTETTHYAVTRLTDEPMQLLADGRIADSPLRWRVVQGDLLIENSGFVPETWRLHGVQQGGAQQRIVQVSYEGIKGLSTAVAEAYQRDPALALTRAALLGEWRIDRLLRSFELRDDGSATLRTHHSAFAGQWQLLPDGTVAMDLQNDQGAMRLYWHAVADEGKQLLLVETGHVADAPDQSFTPAPYRYEHALMP